MAALPRVLSPLGDRGWGGRTLQRGQCGAGTHGSPRAHGGTGPCTPPSAELQLPAAPGAAEPQLPAWPWPGTTPPSMRWEPGLHLPVRSDGLQIPALPVPVSQSRPCSSQCSPQRSQSPSQLPGVPRFPVTPSSQCSCQCPLLPAAPSASQSHPSSQCPHSELPLQLPVPLPSFQGSPSSKFPSVPSQLPATTSPAPSTPQPPLPRPPPAHTSTPAPSSSTPQCTLPYSSQCLPCSWTTAPGSHQDGTRLPVPPLQNHSSQCPQFRA